MTGANERAVNGTLAEFVTRFLLQFEHRHPAGERQAAAARRAAGEISLRCRRARLQKPADHQAPDNRELRTQFHTKFQWWFFCNALRKSPPNFAESAEKSVRFIVRRHPSGIA